MIAIRVEGGLSIGEDVVLRFFPKIAGLLEEIMGRGWSYSFINVEGRAKVILDPSRVTFKLEYYPPSIRDLEDKGHDPGLPAPCTETSYLMST